MSDLQVVYDPSTQVGAIVDLDTNQGWGPICPGPEGGELLQSFIDGMPFDITILTSQQATDIFMSVFREQAAASIAAQGQDTTENVDAGANPPTDEQALATAEAVATGDPAPEPAPHDADVAANTSQEAAVAAVDPTQSTEPDTQAVGQIVPEVTTTTTNCLVCNSDGTGSKDPACPVCKGTGQVASA